jgi:speckle-type POZ protein
MAAPAAPGALVPAPGDAAGSACCTTSTTTLTRRGVHTHVWRLEGLTPADFRDAAVGDKLVSGDFVALGSTWCLRLRPNGLTKDDAFHVGLGLVLRTPDSTVPATHYEMRIHEHVHLGQKALSTVLPQPQETAVSCGCFRLVPHAQLLANFDAYAPGGVLSVEVKLWQQRTAEACPNPALTVPPHGLVPGLGALLASGDNADVTLVCGDERLRAHALLLCVQSPVFAAQLREGPMKADASAVPVPPEITPHTLRRLLHFIYTDELEPTSPEEATHLLNAADHYGLCRLFGICEAALCAALSADNAADTLTLADQHGAAALKDAALRFVAANALAVMATEGWTHLLSSRPALIAEAMHTTAAGAPPVPPAPAEGQEGDAGGVDDGAERRVRRRTR